MKKILFFALALVIMATPIFATETGASADVEAVETVSTVTSIASVTGIAVLLSSIIIFIITKLGWLKKTLGAILNAFTVIFSKGGNVENVPQAIADVKASFGDLKAEFEKVLADEHARFENLKAEYEAQHKENSEFRQAFALFCIYANNVNPYIKNEIYRLIKGEIPFGATVSETANTISEIANAIKEADAKIETPCLDTLVKE